MGWNPRNLPEPLRRAIEAQSPEALRAAMGGEGKPAAGVKPAAGPAPPRGPGSGNKNHAVRTVGPNGVVYPSKLQAQTADHLIRAYGRKHIVEEVSFAFGVKGARSRVRVDFLVIHEVMPDGRFVGEFIDAKGRDMPAGVAKYNHLLDAHGLAVRLIRRQDLPK